MRASSSGASSPSAMPARCASAWRRAKAAASAGTALRTRRRPVVALQPVVGNLVPHSLRSDERAVLRSDSRVTVERAQPDRDFRALRPRSAEERRPASRAEDFHRALARAEDAQQFLASQQTESLALHAALRKPERPRVLAAARAVTVVRAPERRGDLESNTAAEAAAAERLVDTGHIRNYCGHGVQSRSRSARGMPCVCSSR